MSCQDDKSSNRSRETAGNRDPGTPPGGAPSLTSHGTSAATGKAANQSMPQLPPRVLGSASVSLEISLSRVPSRRSPSAHFFSPGQVLLEPHDCVRRIETSGNGPSILAPRRATAWRHNACAQPKRLDQSLFALWCVFIALTRPASATPSAAVAQHSSCPQHGLPSTITLNAQSTSTIQQSSGRAESHRLFSLHCPTGTWVS